MKRSTQNKFVQTDPVIILPITEYNDVPLPDYHSPNGTPPGSSAVYHMPPPITHPARIYCNTDDSPYERLEHDVEKDQSIMENNMYDIEDESSYETMPETTKKPLTIFSPVYILKESLSLPDVNDWEAGDEFEFISHVHGNPNILCLEHLRTSTVTNMDRSWVELDENTPLRLGIQDRGTIECFLLKCDARYSFLIHRSDQDKNVYILSVNEHNITKEALISHYFIRINKENNCFYLEHERKLRHCFFPTFQQLVNNATVHQFIPLSKPIDRNLAMDIDELWQIDYRELIVAEKVGAGEFGTVMRGKWKRTGLFEMVDVAIKRLKLNNVASNEFAEEIRTMKRLRNKYLVSLLGISVDPITNEKLMITEFMIDGDLKKWLEKQFKLPSDDVLLNYCHQICLGMSYLERNYYVHRDLACRNIFLRGDRAKIGDFGIGAFIEEDPYYKDLNTSIGKVPFRWTAPEIFTGQAYTTRSDVWSFGICLVEIWSKGGLPYPSLKHLTEVKLKIEAGYVHDRPPQCPRIYYNIIRHCLVYDPNYRLSFTELTDHFKTLLINKNEKDMNRTLKTKNGIIRYNHMKEKGASKIVDLQTFLSKKIGDASENQNSYTVENKQHFYASTTVTKSQFSSPIPNVGSGHIITTADNDSGYEVVSPNNCPRTSSPSYNNYHTSYSVHENDKKYSSKSFTPSVEDETNDYVYMPSESTSRKVDSQKETNEDTAYWTF